MAAQELTTGAWMFLITVWSGAYFMLGWVCRGDLKTKMKRGKINENPKA